MNLKRLWLITIAVLLCSISLSADPVEIDKIWYNLSLDTKTAEVTSGDKYYSSSVTIPSEVVYDEVVYSVTSIGEEAFSSCLSLTSVTIPESVTSIGNYAFSECSALTSIVIPEGVTSIGDGAFFCCFGLTTVIIPEGVAYIGEGAFYLCRNLTSLNIPEGVTKIGKSTFSDCRSFTTIVIPEGVTSIDQMAFAGCSGLTSITLPKSLQNIGSSVFYSCTSLTTINIPENSQLTSIGTGVFSNCTSLAEITIPESVTSIGNSALSGCSSLTTITILENSQLTSIGSGAFSNCTSLAEITIPESVTSIGNSALSGCSALTSIVIPEGVTSIGNSAFSDCSSLTSVTLPASLTSIGEKVFAGYTGELVINCNIPSANGYSSGMFYGNGFTKVTIGKGVTSIGDYAFYACENLRYVVNYSDLNIQKGWSSNGCVARYAEKVFNVDEVVDGYGFKTIDGVHYLCGYMGDDTDLILPNDYHGDAYWIGDYAFSDYSNITSITIPEGVAGIGNNAFANCIGELVINCDIPSGNSAFYDNKFTKISIGENVTRIGDYAFYNSNSLTEFIISENSQLGSIGSEAFCYCSNLSDIILPESVTSIGDDAFHGTAWYDNQPDGIVYIGKVLYRYKGTMPNSTSIKVKAGTVSIGNNAFDGCSGLLSITIPESVVSIGESVFNDCFSLTNVFFESGDKILSLEYNEYNPYDGGKGLFYDCPLETVYLGRNMSFPSSWRCGMSPFYDISTLNSVTIGENVTSIEAYTFWGTGLNSIFIPKGVTSIGNMAFCNNSTSISVDESNSVYDSRNNCNAIIETSTNTLIVSCRSTIIPESVTAIGDNAFNGCNGLVSVTIPKSVTSIGYEAFLGCGNLTEVHINSLETWCKISFGGDGWYYSNSNSNPLSYAHNLYLNGDLVTELVIPEGVASIGSQAFSGCTSITSASIPESVKSIENEAFYNCNSLRLVINYSDLDIQKGSSDYGYVTYYAERVLNVDEIIDGYGFKTINNVHYLNSYIGNDTELVLPEDYHGENYQIDSEVFSGCSSITSVSIPGSVTGIGDGAFRGCGLTEITIPKSVGSIGGEAFYECSDLLWVVNYSDLDIQKGSSDYGYVAYYAERVLNVDEIIDGYGFKTINNVHYLNSYIGDDTELVLPEDYHGENYQIGSEVFSGCGITAVIIPECVTSIGEGAFYECCNLATITLPESVASIEYGAFSECSSLNSIVIPEESQLASIGAYAFADCSSLTTITLPKGVVYIGEGAFFGCGLTSITVAEGNAMYDSRNGCNAIVETNTNTLVVGCATTVIPESVTSIGEGAFAGCCSLKSITIPGGVESIGMFAFEGCSDLTTVVFSEGVTSIGEGSFMFCSALSFISIPASVTNIGNRAFEDCCNLCDVYCYATSIPLVESETFNEFGVQNATLHVPVSALDAYKVAYLWSDFGNIVSITGVDTKLEMLGIEEENIIYDIYGRRVDNSTNGLYIVNGHKVLIK